MHADFFSFLPFLMRPNDISALYLLHTVYFQSPG